MTNPHSTHRPLWPRTLTITAVCLILSFSASSQGPSQWTTAQNNVDIYKTDTNGNVGIGTTAPGFPLTVKAPNTTAQQLYLQQDNTDNGWIFYANRANGNLDFLRRGEDAPPSNTNLVSINTGGNLLVGATGLLGGGSSGKEEITSTGSGATTIALNLINKAGADNTGVAIDFTPNTNIPLARLAAYRNESAGSGCTNLQFFTYPGSAGTGLTEAMRIQYNGNVGIGTASPAKKLHVAGDVQVDGNIAAKYQDVAEWVPASKSIPAGFVVIVDVEHANQVTTSSTAYDTRVAGVITVSPGIILGEAGEGKVKVATTGRVKVRVDASRKPIRIGDLLVTSDRAGIAMRSEPVNLSGILLHRPGTLIGKALEPLEKGEREILVLLSLQ